jgi:DNA-directed RNA polymerase specialized sigma24 family protein
VSGKTKVDEDPADGQRRSVADGQVVDLLESGRFDGIVRQLHSRYREHADLDDVKNAVTDAVEAFYGRALQAEVASPDGYVYRAAHYILLEQYNRRRSTRAVSDDDEDHGPAAPTRDLTEALAFVEKLIDAWPTDHRKVITAAVVRAAAAGDQLTGRELVEIGRSAGYEMSEDAARSWKSRGLARLRQEVADLGVTLLDLLPTDPEPDPELDTDEHDDEREDE